MHEVLAVAVGDAGQRAHRAGHDHHALGLERAGRDRGAHVALAVHHGREPAHLLDRVAGLVLEGALRPLADDEMAFDPAVLERLEHPHAEDGAGRSGHADDETPHYHPRVAVTGTEAYVAPISQRLSTDGSLSYHRLRQASFIG